MKFLKIYFFGYRSIVWLKKWVVSMTPSISQQVRNFIVKKEATYKLTRIMAIYKTEQYRWRQHGRRE